MGIADQGLPRRLRAATQVGASRSGARNMPLSTAHLTMADRHRLTILEEKMRSLRRQLEASKRQNDEFMDYVLNFNSILAQQFPTAPFPQPPILPSYPPPTAHSTMTDRLTILEENVQSQERQLDAFQRRNDAFMCYVFDFNSIVAQQFPTAPFPQPPILPPYPQDNEEADDHYD